METDGGSKREREKEIEGEGERGGSKREIKMECKGLNRQNEIAGGKVP